MLAGLRPYYPQRFELEANNVRNVNPSGALNNNNANNANGLVPRL